MKPAKDSQVRDIHSHNEAAPRTAQEETSAPSLDSRPSDANRGLHNAYSNIAGRLTGDMAIDALHALAADLHMLYMALGNADLAMGHATIQDYVYFLEGRAMGMAELAEHLRAEQIREERRKDATAATDAEAA